MESTTTILILSAACLLRILIGYQPHSGQDDHHGAQGAYGGDYEAQRHWMELTWHLPVGDWYWYDLEYWGLDYPPLTAYVSYACGWASERFVGPETVALDTSRGYEDSVHKSFMRCTVLVLDMLFYMTIAWYYVRQRGLEKRFGQKSDMLSAWTLVLALAQPAIVLIDHGHFQYNTVALGLSLWSFHFMTRPDFKGCILGSIFFCLALNFKQMTLYYAPAVFAYLLGRCVSGKFFQRFCMLGATVIATFAVLWWPLLMYGPTHRDTTVLERLQQVLHRIFPFQRGLFESKVSNLWCALSVKPLSFRDRVDPKLQPLMALAVTIILTLPACVKLFKAGASRKNQSGDDHSTLLLWGCGSSSLAFFLASFQVHEKSILIALAPLTLLWWCDARFVEWISLASVWSMWPLLQVDRLQIAYVCSICMFLSLVRLSRLVLPASGGVFSSRWAQWIPFASYAGMLTLHMVEILLDAPPRLPDLYPVLWSVVGCSMFCVAWLATCLQLYGLADRRATDQKVKES